MPYPQRKMNGTRPRWLAQPMSDRRLAIAGICIHSTRGGAGSSIQNEGRATENWMGNPSNGSASQGWGGSCDLIIFGDGTRVEVCDWELESPTYGAGYGSGGSWNCSRFFLQVELSQHVPSAAFDERTIDSLAEWTAEMSVKYDFPIVRLPFLEQTEAPIPHGITSHDSCMNGRKLGKSDPGYMFPWDRFIDMANNYRAALTRGSEPEPAQGPVTREEFDALRELVAAHYDSHHPWLQDLHGKVYDELMPRVAVLDGKAANTTMIDVDQGRQLDELRRRIERM